MPDKGSGLGCLKGGEPSTEFNKSSINGKTIHTNKCQETKNTRNNTKALPSIVSEGGISSIVQKILPKTIEDSRLSYLYGLRQTHKMLANMCPIL